MPKTKISEFSSTPASNTDIDSINISEGCAPSGINDAIRELMAQLKDFQTGAVGDSFNGPVGTTTAAAGAFTTLSATSTLGVTGVSTLTGGAVVQGLTVGRGAGAVATNTAVGASALGTTNTEGGQTAVGYQALTSVTSGGFINSAFGWETLKANTTGTTNVGIGARALTGNTTGSSSTAVGYQALQANTTASSNVAVGYQAGYTTTTGQYNTYIGTSAGNLTTGSNNQFIGNGAGRSVTTGSGNSIIGNYSGNQGGLDIRTSSNNIVLSDGDGNPLISTADNQTVALEGAVPNSGTGITFPATQSASSNANTLDDYEEGTWTPAQGSGLTVVGAYSSSGQYTKIGRSVTVFGLIAGATSVACASNGQLCTGLPFTPNTEFQGALINGARSFSNNVGALGSGAVQNSTALVATTSASFTITYFV